MVSGNITRDPSTDNEILTTDDGSIYVTNAKGQLVSVTTTQHVPGQPDVTTTTTYTAWDPVTNKPIAGVGPDGGFTLAYQGGNTIETLDKDKSVYVTNGQGQLVSVTTTQHVPGQPDVTTTTTYTAWDPVTNKPIAGVGPDGGFTLAYQGGNTIETLDKDKSVYVTNGQGQLVSVTTTQHVPGQPDVTTTTTYTAWDPVTNKPIAGVGPDGSHFTLAYQGGNTIETLDKDKSVYVTNGQGQLVSVTTTQHVPGQPDVTTTTTYTAWDPVTNKPIAGVGPDGSHFTLAYQGGNTIETLDKDKSVYVTNGQGQLVSVTTTQHVPGQPDVTTTTTYTAWDPVTNKPIAGVGPDGSHFTLAYQGGNTIETLDKDKSVYVTNGQGQLVSVTTTQHVPGQPDVTTTTTYTAWDPVTNKPIAGVGPDGSHFTLAYQGGNTIETLDKDKSVYVTNGQGQLVSVTTTQHVPGQPDVTTTTTYTAWDPVTNKPIAGVGPDGGFTLAYQGGNTIETLDKDKSVYVTNGQGQLVSVTTTQNVQGKPVQQTTTYTAWDPVTNKPIAGVGPDGSHFTLAYQGGNTIETLDKDKSVYVTNAKGQPVSVTTTQNVQGKPVQQTTTYTAWDPVTNKPIAGVGPDGSHFTITYDPTTGDEIIKYDGGPLSGEIVKMGPNGKLVSITLPDGTFVDWYVQLEELGTLARNMGAYEHLISSYISGILFELKKVGDVWVAPAAQSFDAIAQEFQAAATTLQNLLTEAAKRMQQTYTNLIDAETINAT